MNVVLDTNILIPLEDTGKELDPRLAKMRSLCSRNGIILYRHPAQEEDLKRDKNNERRKIVLSRIEQYQSIQNPPQFSEIEKTNFVLGENSENDRIDNLILCSLYRNACHLIVTEDRGIHRKARLLGIEERVHFIDGFLDFIASKIGKESLPPLGIKDVYLHQLKIEDVFFDSLRDGYTGFDAWFGRISRDQRRAWIVEVGHQLVALCIRKIEKDEAVTTTGEILRGMALKLCTFKVGEAWRGRKIGERFLFTAFKHAAEEGCSWVYLTAFGKEHEMLVELCQNFGFEYIGKDKNNGRDDVYCKDMRKPLSYAGIGPLKYAVRYYPYFLDDDSITKLLVPIQPRFHNTLFPDISDIVTDLFANAPEFYDSYSNTIKKAYLCHAQISKINAGDILLFYRSGDRRSIQCVGIVEHSFKSTDVNEILAHVSKRTVYTNDQIAEMVAKKVLVILFRLIKYLDKPITVEQLEATGIKMPIQTIRTISHEAYLKMRLING